MTVGRASFPFGADRGGPGDGAAFAARVQRVMDASGKNQSYLPSFETAATRKGFDPRPIEQLARQRNPQWVFIGDSMLGTRIEPPAARRASRRRRRATSMFSFQAATGPAWWYLAFKNQLVASGVKPRDDVLLLPRHQPDRHDVPAGEPARRRAGRSGARRGARAGRDRRCRVSAASGGASIAALNRAYEVDVASAWLEPAIRRWYALWRYPEPEVRARTSRRVDRRRFQRATSAATSPPTSAAPDERRRLRPRPADVGAAADHRAVAQRTTSRCASCACSAGPSAIGRRRSRPRCERYVADFRAWVEAQGACSTTTPAIPR